MSFNDLAKKEAADKKASHEKDTKPQTATGRPPEATTAPTDPKTGREAEHLGFSYPV